MNAETAIPARIRPRVPRRFPPSAATATATIAPVKAKTGTAQVFSRKRNEDNRSTPEEDHLKPHAWFVAYAPSESPQIAVAVIVEHGEHGSSAAAPIAQDMILAYLRGGKKN